MRAPSGELQPHDDARTVRQLTDDHALVLSPAWSPDSRHIYFASSRGGTVNLWKIPTNGGRAEQITAGEGDDAQLDVSLDGKEIVFSTWRLKTNIAQLDLAGNPGQQTPKSLTVDPGRNQVAPAYSPNGKYVAYFSNLKGAENESIWVSNADGSNPVLLVRDGQINVFPSWTNDGLNVIYQSEHQSGSRKLYDFRSIPLSGGAPTTIAKKAGIRFFDVGFDGRLLFLTPDNRVEAFDPRARTMLALGTIQTNANWLSPVRWSPDGRSVAYMVAATHEHDSAAGLWVTNFKDPPRQIFNGWADWYFTNGPQKDIYFIEGKPDLNGALCKVDWNGHLARTSVTIPMSRSYWVDPAQDSEDYFSISPDGRHVAFETQTVLTANIGMIQNVR